MVAPSLDIVTSYTVGEISLLKCIIGGCNSTPMLSTSILSRPSGPRELLIIFAMDCAAMTGTSMSDLTEKSNEKMDHFGL